MKRAVPIVVLCAAVLMLGLPALAADAPDGKAIYASKCAMCHGADGVAKAMAKGSRNFNDPAFTASVDEIVKVTHEGKGKMPKMEGKLTPEEMKAVAEYVKTMAPKK